MQYQISYYSPNGRAETLVNAFCQMLPHDTYISNLEEEDVPYADIQLVGFDMGGTNLDAIPFKVIEYLEKLDGKVTALEEKPIRRADGLVDKIIWAICAAVITFVLAQIGL